MEWHFAVRHSRCSHTMYLRVKGHRVAVQQFACGPLGRSVNARVGATFCTRGGDHAPWGAKRGAKYPPHPHGQSKAYTSALRIWWSASCNAGHTCQPLPGTTHTSTRKRQRRPPRKTMNPAEGVHNCVEGVAQKENAPRVRLTFL